MGNQKNCDHKSVGMLVWQNDKLLLNERRKPPYGFAPPAGHLDGNESFEEMAKIELFEETGLNGKSLKFLIEGRKENPCRRIDGNWHYWKIFEIETSGEVNASEEETKQVIWLSKDQLRKLAQRTEQYQAGNISEADWNENPGLEIVWYEWLKELKII